MPFVRLAVYQFRPGSTDAVIQRGKLELLAFFKQQPGFIAYEVVRTGADTGFSINHWTTAEAAGNAQAKAQAWMQEHFAPVLVSAVSHIGEVAFSSRAEPIATHTKVPGKR